MVKGHIQSNGTVELFLYQFKLQQPQVSTKISQFFIISISLHKNLIIHTEIPQNTLYKIHHKAPFN
jgi:hypothetical protein